MTWHRAGDTALEKVRHRQGQEGTRYTLTINKVQSTDLGSYSCRARSDLGTSTADIELTGQPTAGQTGSAEGKHGRQLGANMATRSRVRHWRGLLRGHEMSSAALRRVIKDT